MIINARNVHWLLIFITLSKLYAPSLTITTPGLVRLPNNITYTPTAGPDSIIQINASDVVLDIDDSYIETDGSVSNIAGIEIVAGNSNIIIKNGLIRNLTSFGIIVRQNCRNIQIQNVQCINCNSGGIQFDGLFGTIQECMVRGSTIYRCCTTGGGQGLSIIGVTNSIFDSCNIVNCGNAVTTFTGVAMVSCFDCTGVDIGVLSSSGVNHISYDIQSSTSCMMNSCLSRNNRGATTTFQGFNIGPGSSLNILKDCIAADNQATTLCTGYLLTGSAQQNELRRCSAESNTGTFVNGFELARGAASFNTNNSFFNCIAQNNRATTGDCTGFNVNGSDFGLMLQCVGSFNQALSGVCSGLQFTTGTAGNNWFVQECSFVRNFGSSAANSFGTRNAVAAGTATSSWFINNVAFNNGTTANNQMNAVPAGSRTSSNTSGINTGNAFTNYQGTPA